MRFIWNGMQPQLHIATEFIPFEWITNGKNKNHSNAKWKHSQCEFRIVSSNFLSNHLTHGYFHEAFAYNFTIETNKRNDDYRLLCVQLFVGNRHSFIFVYFPLWMIFVDNVFFFRSCYFWLYFCQGNENMNR